MTHHDMAVLALILGVTEVRDRQHMLALLAPMVRRPRTRRAAPASGTPAWWFAATLSTPRGSR